ncbi:MAG: DNA alkylation repair protein [Rhodospirillales bacterium]|nr:DNA alkylation repair protein [Rhodospirillales bacterium]
MAEPFKNLFNRQMIEGMAAHFARVYPAFDGGAYVATATDGLEGLELKQRAAQIEAAMDAYLPQEFSVAAQILLASLHPDQDAVSPDRGFDENGIRGWAILPMSHFVGRRGQGDLALSMNLMKEMTKRFSSEFGIRFLLLEQTERVLRVLKEWTVDPNRHVRRLVSEGTRPRLPWAMRLPMFVKNPAPILPLIEALKDDPDEYVRRSVANNLNDISKDHPDLVAEVARRWLERASADRIRLVRHALRTLVKQGHPGALAVLGYGEAKVRLDALNVMTPHVGLGGALEFKLVMSSQSIADQRLVIDYAVHHRKANGNTSPKVFKWKTMNLKAGETVEAVRRHPMRRVTTRTYYSGLHHIEILVNGKAQGRGDFELSV